MIVFYKIRQNVFMYDVRIFIRKLSAKCPFLTFLLVVFKTVSLCPILVSTDPQLSTTVFILKIGFYN